MRKIALFVLGVSVLGVGMAQANEEHGRRRDRHDHYRFQCHYQGAAKGAPANVKGATGGQCTAYGEFHKFRHDRDDRDDRGDRQIERRRDRDRDDDFERFRRDHVTIRCNGTILYTGEASSSSTGGFEYISANHNGDPSIKFPLTHSHQDAFIVSSWLNTQGVVTEGYCAIEKERDRDRDSRPSPRPPCTTTSLEISE